MHLSPNKSELEVFVSALNNEMENAKQSLAKSIQD
ncbi:MAG: hypothetical protein CM15mP127_14590 [Gammaproteobacteria bacterium]|nr:MAG: hypothetical protein CM15mP127_14590 [Gammaproteobacteria bacterium]